MNLRNAVLLLFFCLLYSFLTAQVKQTDYPAKWKQVDSLARQKGLVQSALTEVNKIYALAKAEKNDVQVIRALIYRINLQETTREDAGLSAIEDLEKEISVTGQPARSILQNILATTYWSYFQQHRRQLYNRTATVNFVKKDIATWGAADLHQKIGEFRHGSQAKLTTWIFTIAKNRAIDYHRVSQPEYLELTEEMGEPSGAREGVYAGRNRDQLKWLLDELNELPEADQVLLKWRALEIPYAQVAEWLGIAEGTARVRHKRVMEKLLGKAAEMTVEKGAEQR